MKLHIMTFSAVTPFGNFCYNFKKKNYFPTNLGVNFIPNYANGEKQQPVGKGQKKATN